MTTATETKPKEKTFFTIKATANGTSVKATKPTIDALQTALERVKAAVDLPGLGLAKMTGAYLERFIAQCKGEKWEPMVDTDALDNCDTDD